MPWGKLSLVLNESTMCVNFELNRVHANDTDHFVVLGRGTASLLSVVANKRHLVEVLVAISYPSSEFLGHKPSTMLCLLSIEDEKLNQKEDNHRYPPH